MLVQTCRHLYRRVSGTVSGITAALTRPLFDRPRADNRQQGMREERQREVPIPAVPLADFVLIQSAGVTLAAMASARCSSGP
jgi:hypothetical protein